MSLPQFFLEQQVLGDEPKAPFVLRLSAADQKHARALRLKSGEHLAAIDASGDYFECVVTSFSDDGLFVRIAAREEVPTAGPSVILVQGIAKGEKMDAVIRQGTEIGVGAFIPFACERSVVRLDPKKAKAKTDRWRSVAKSAAMQSGQRVIPEVSEPMDLTEVCGFIAQANAVVVCWEEERRRSIKSLIGESLGKQQIDPRDARVAVIVGPEGGISSHEASTLVAANRYAATVSLGPAVLRTETAGVLAPALTLYELGALS